MSEQAMDKLHCRRTVVEGLKIFFDSMVNSKFSDFKFLNLASWERSLTFSKYHEPDLVVGDNLWLQ